MSENVSWPKASQGGRVFGKQDIRKYWARQWTDFGPRVDVLEVIEHEGGRTEVRVHQLVRNHKGDVLSDTELWHVYIIRNDLIEQMDILEANSNKEGQSAAFADHGR